MSDQPWFRRGKPDPQVDWPSEFGDGPEPESVPEFVPAPPRSFDQAVEVISSMIHLSLSVRSHESSAGDDEGYSRSYDVGAVKIAGCDQEFFLWPDDDYWMLGPRAGYLMPLVHTLKEVDARAVGELITRFEYDEGGPEFPEPLRHYCKVVARLREAVSVMMACDVEGRLREPSGCVVTPSYLKAAVSMTPLMASP